MSKTKVFDDDFPDVNKSKLLPLHPYRCIFAGSSGCGKTNMLLNLLLDKNSPFEQIYFYYKCWQPKYDILKEKFEKTKKRQDKSLIFVEGMPDERLINILKKYKDVPKVVILDDLVTDSHGSKLLADLFTRGSHHLNTSVIVLHQSIFNDKILRLNCEYMFLWSFPCDMSNARILFQQMEPMRWKEIYKAYEDCTKKPHSWFMVDLKCHHIGQPHLKYRCNALDQIICFDDIDNDYREKIDHEAVDDLK